MAFVSHDVNREYVSPKIEKETDFMRCEKCDEESCDLYPCIFVKGEEEELCQ